MARPEATGRKPIQVTAVDHADAYSVDEFCARHRISRQRRGEHLGMLFARN